MKNKGFTLLEVMIAIFVLLTGILGTFAATRQIVSYISFSNSKLTATYLAQEGVEIVRNIRDTNWLQGEDWGNGLTNCAEGCEADYTIQDIIDDGYDGDFLRIGDDGFYNYSFGPSTKFKRKIIIEPIDTNNDGENDLKITVLVEWKEGGKAQEITVRENLYNWY